MPKPEFHGRDHRPAKYGGTAATEGGGADPTTGMLYLPSSSETDGQVLTRDSTTAHGLKWDTGSASTYRNPAIVYEVGGYDWFLYYDDSRSSNVTPTVDATAPYGAYLEIAVTGGLFIMGCPLGPAGSRWRIDLWYSIGTDYGKMEFSWQTSPADVPGETSESVEEPHTITSWYYADAAAAPQIDAYNASPDVSFDTQHSLFTPTGADGDMLSADGTPSGVFSATQEMNGGGDGGVWWWLRVRSAAAVGKNASSTGYRQRIHKIRICRLVQDGFTPL